MTVSPHRTSMTTWSLLAMPALTVVLGMQTMRTIFPLWVFVLRDRLDWSAPQVGVLALAVFSTSFLIAPIHRWLGARRIVMIGAGGLALGRLSVQLWRGDPLGDLALATASVVFLILFFPPYLALIRANRSRATATFAPALLLGFALDATIHGAFQTLDPSWRDDPVSLLIVAGLAAILLWLVVRLPAYLPRDGAGDHDTFLGLALTWIGFGLVLFLELLIFANLARLTQLTGWTQPQAFLWLLISQAAGIALVVWLPGQMIYIRPLAFALGALLVVMLIDIWPPEWIAALLLLFGQVAVALLLNIVVHGIEIGDPQPGLAHLSVGHGAGMVAFTALTFLFYASYDILLPFPNTVWPLIAAAGLGVAAVGAAQHRPRNLVGESAYQAAIVALILLAVPLVQLITWQSPEASTAQGFPVRVVNYNLHDGFDPDGRLAIERIAQAIEKEQPDIVTLQEVARGWLIFGSLDMMTWLSQRLQMPYVYAPTAGPLWGNAILSRLPIVEHEQHPLPTRDLLLRRGFVRAFIDIGVGAPLEVIATHYDHLEQDSDVRVQESQAVLDFWHQRAQTVFAGDLNAEPGTAEIEMLKEAGLQSASELVGLVPGYTSPSRNAEKTIDYILLSPDLTALQSEILPVDASDHLPISALISAAD